MIRPRPVVVALLALMALASPPPPAAASPAPPMLSVAAADPDARAASLAIGETIFLRVASTTAVWLALHEAGGIDEVRIGAGAAEGGDRPAGPHDWIWDAVMGLAYVVTVVGVGAGGNLAPLFVVSEPAGARLPPGRALPARSQPGRREAGSVWAKSS